jgi:hypothetical protein
MRRAADTHHLMQGFPLLRVEEPGRECIIGDQHLQAPGRQQNHNSYSDSGRHTCAIWDASQLSAHM